MPCFYPRPANHKFGRLGLDLSLAAARPFSALAQSTPEKSLDNIVSTATPTPQSLVDLLADSTTITAEETAQSGVGLRRYDDNRAQSRLGAHALYGRNRFSAGGVSQLQISQSRDDLRSTSGIGSGSAYRIATDAFNTTQNSLGWQSDITFGPDLLQSLLDRPEEHVDARSGVVERRRSTNSAALSNFLLREALDLQNPHDETSDRQLQRRAKRHAVPGVGYSEWAWRAGADAVVSSAHFEYSGSTVICQATACSTSVAVMHSTGTGLCSRVSTMSFTRMMSWQKTMPWKDPPCFREFVMASDNPGCIAASCS